MRSIRVRTFLVAPPVDVTCGKVSSPSYLQLPFPAAGADPLGRTTARPGRGQRPLKAPLAMVATPRWGLERVRLRRRASAVLSRPGAPDAPARMDDDLRGPEAPLSCRTLRAPVWCRLGRLRGAR